MKYRKDSKNELQYLLALLNTSNLLFYFGTKLLKLLPNIADLFAMSFNELIEIGIPASAAMKLVKPDWARVEKDLCWSQKNNHHIITINDESYPQLLREIPNPPVVLFVIGNLSLLKSLQMAIVGSRNPTPIGCENAFNFARELVQTNLVITSGFAIGIDAASHRGAIAGLGKTIAVMGTGLNKLYPSRHADLAKDIVITGGVLLSEFPLNAAGEAWHFPLRNRIISGLSVGTLVIEATMRSGSLITARLAGEQGREVFAVPGSICNTQARGCHYLIRQGAKLVEQATDILEEFKELVELKQLSFFAVKKCKIKNKLDRMHSKLLNCIGFEITTIDDMVVRTGWSVPQISAMLLELELQGFIAVTMNGYIKKE